MNCTFEDNEFIQYDPISTVKMYYVGKDGIESEVHCIQRVVGATGWAITHGCQANYFSEVLDDTEFTLHIYENPLVL